MSKVLLDTNIIVYALNQSSPKHSSAQSFISSNQSKLVVCPQNIIESLKVLTHPKNPHPMTISQAVSAITGISDALTIIYPKPGSEQLLCQLALQYKITGLQLFDLQLVVTMIQNQISSIATENTHDFKLHPIKIINPFALTSA